MMTASLVGARSFFLPENARSIHTHPVFMRRHIIGLLEFLVEESDVPVTDLFADGFDRGVGILQQDAGVVEAQFLDQRDIGFSGLALDESAQITWIELESIGNLLQAAVLIILFDEEQDVTDIGMIRLAVFAGLFLLESLQQLGKEDNHVGVGHIF